MAQVRRKFVEVYEREGASIAGEAIKRIAKLYAVEKAARGKPAEEREAMRKDQAKPIFEALETWLAEQLPKISGKSKLAEAIRYAQGGMAKGRGYLSNGRVTFALHTWLGSHRTTAGKAMRPAMVRASAMKNGITPRNTS